MSLASELGVILAQLGDSPDAVAASLSAAGIKGVRNTVRFLNPIVRFCQALLHVDDYDLDLMERDAVRIKVPSGFVEHVPLPQAVYDFLVAFDRGDFSDLELPR